MVLLTLRLVVLEPILVLLGLAQLVVVLNRMAVVVIVVIALVRLALLLEAGEDILSIDDVEVVLVKVVLDEGLQVVLVFLLFLFVFHEPAPVIFLHLTYNYKVKVNLISI